VNRHIFPRVWYSGDEVIAMNRRAAAFACHITGIAGLLASLLLWKVEGLAGLTLGLLASLLWFVLGWRFGRPS
jgi:hypothetical protein